MRSNHAFAYGLVMDHRSPSGYIARGRARRLGDSHLCLNLVIFAQSWNVLRTSTNSDADIQMLRDSLQAQQIVLASGKQAVALGGDVNDAVIITGNGNLVCLFKGADAEAVRKFMRAINSRPDLFCM